MDEIQQQMQQMQAMGGQAPQEGQPQSQGGEPAQVPQDMNELETLSKSTLSEMEKEIAELETSLDANYAEEFVKGMSQEENELATSDLAKFLREYEKRKAIDLEQKLKPKREKVHAFKENLHKIENSRERFKIEQEFNAKHKGTSAAKVIEYFKNDLSKREQEEFAKKWNSNNTSGLQQLEEIAAMMKKGKKQDELPFDVSGEKYGATDSGGEYTSAFLKR